MSQGKTDLPPGMVTDGTKVKIEGEYLSDPSRYMYRLVIFLNFLYLSKIYIWCCDMKFSLYDENEIIKHSCSQNLMNDV